MGCTQSNHILPPNLPAAHISRLLQVAEINNNLNVNKKYQYVSKIIPSKKVNSGLKQTFAYQCLTTREELTAKRKQFWETRVNGSPEIWKMLSTVVHSKNEEIGAALNKHSISPIGGTIQMCVDQKGNKYQLPIFVINEPISFGAEKLEDRNLIQQYQSETIKLRIRTVKYPNQDLVFDCNTSTTIQQIKAWIRQSKKLGNVSIRFFFNGRQLHETKTLGNYGYIGQTVIQAMIKD